MSEIGRTWQVYTQGQYWGPYTAEELQGYLGAGQMEPAAMVMGPGMRAWMPAYQVFGMPQAPAYSPPSPPPISYRPRRKPRGFFARWKHAAGGRSFVFQLICMGWTACIVLLATAQLFGIASDKPDPSEYGYYDRDFENTAKAGALLVSWTCLAAAWALIFIPFFIAAIATWGPDARAAAVVVADLTDWDS